MKKTMIIAALSLVAAGCYNDKYDKLYPSTATTSVTCDTTSITFSHDIMPIITAKCAISGGCHDASGGAVNGYDFTTYAGVQPEAANGNLMGDINWASGHNQMPQGASKLPDCEINKFTRWVNQGALNN